MSEAAIYDQLRPIFTEVFGREVALRPALSAADVAGWDSFRHIDLILAVEERFALKFSTPELDTMRNLGDLVAVIVARGQGA